MNRAAMAKPLLDKDCLPMNLALVLPPQKSYISDAPRCYCLPDAAAAVAVVGSD